MGKRDRLDDLTRAHVLGHVVRHVLGRMHLLPTHTRHRACERCKGETLGCRVACVASRHHVERRGRGGCSGALAEALVGRPVGLLVLLDGHTGVSLTDATARWLIRELCCVHGTEQHNLAAIAFHFAARAALHTKMVAMMSTLAFSRLCRHITKEHRRDLGCRLTTDCALAVTTIASLARFVHRARRRISLGLRSGSFCLVGMDPRVGRGGLLRRALIHLADLGHLRRQFRKCEESESIVQLI
jgi:hypothetical protein